MLRTTVRPIGQVADADGDPDKAGGAATRPCGIWPFPVKAAGREKQESW